MLVYRDQHTGFLLPYRHGAMYCVSQLRAFASYGDCLNVHSPDKGGLTVMSNSIFIPI